MNLKYNYHTHTYRCGHAFGKDYEFVEKAIESGFKILGFSDHVMLKGHPQPGVRGKYSQLNGYLRSINKLKKRYADKIEIHLGLECEYLPSQMKYYNKLLESNKVEYLILGQHCYINKNNKFQSYFDMNHKYEGIELYIRDLIKGMSTGIFSYVAHPDLFVHMLDKGDPYLEKYSKMICDASIKYDVPLEMNLGDLRGYSAKSTKLFYPNPVFWRVAAETGVKTVIGVDAHDPKDFHSSNYNFVFDLINRYQINYLEDYKINGKKKEQIK